MDLRNVKRILVPTDFSDPSAEALGTAIALAQQAGAVVDLVHVAVEAAFALPPPVDVAAVPIDMNRLMEQAAEILSVEEQRVRASGLRCETAMLVGRPDAEIVARANATGAELIVMGTHGRSGIVHALLGSVAERVVQHSPCPVLIVPKRPEKS